jgi:hypothetical protein
MLKINKINYVINIVSSIELICALHQIKNEQLLLKTHNQNL